MKVVEYSKHRFEFFSDGVMAIIITIMVLEIPLTNNFNLGGLTELLTSIFIFFASFFIVGTFWNRHHLLIDHTNTITSKIVWRNHLFLFFLALIPIFTKWILENPDKLMPAFSYDILFLFVNISYLLIVKEVYNKNDVKKIKRSNNGSPIFHILIIVLIIIGIILLGNFIPQISVILFIGFPILFSIINIFVEEHNKEG
jgi:uncharacterized membrane protein